MTLNLNKEKYLKRIQETKVLPDVFDKVIFIKDMLKTLEEEYAFTEIVPSFVIYFFDICARNCHICPWSLFHETVEPKDWMYTTNHGIHLNAFKCLCKDSFDSDIYEGDLLEIIEALEWVINNLE